jgi:hypothetical protein
MLHFWPTADHSTPKNTGSDIAVSEVEKLYTAFELQGITHPEGKLRDMEWEMRQFVIVDNNGNLIHFREDLSQGH